MLNGEWQNDRFLSGEIQRTVIDLTGEPQEKTVVPSMETVVVEPDVAKRLTKVTVLGVTSEIDENISPMNIRRGKTILGVEGNLEPDKPDQSKVVSPSVEEQVVRADTGYELASVTIEGVTSDIDENIQADNIRYGVEILGVVGSMEQREDLDAELNEQEEELGALKGEVEDLPILEFIGDDLTAQEALISDIQTQLDNIPEVEQIPVEDATATESDVVKGKTFFSGNAELKTGTLEVPDLSATTATAEDVLQGKKFYNAQGEFVEGSYISQASSSDDYLAALISGRGEVEIMIPSNITQIRPYAFATMPSGTDPNVFSSKDFTIPSNITHIHEYAFYYTNLTGTLTIPATVQEIYNRAFYYCNISECVIASFTPNTTDIFQGCPNLRKITVAEPVTTLYKSNLGRIRNIANLVLPATLTSMESGVFSGASAPSEIKFLGETPPTITNKVLSDVEGSVLLVPASAYDTYYNATNYTTYKTYMFGYQTFKSGDVLPTTLSGKSVEWYRDYIDAFYGNNKVTVSPSDRELLAKFV